MDGPARALDGLCSSTPHIVLWGPRRDRTPTCLVHSQSYRAPLGSRRAGSPALGFRCQMLSLEPSSPARVVCPSPGTLLGG